MLRKQKEDEESQYVATEFAPDPAFAPSFAPAPAPAPAPVPAPAPAPAPVSINTIPVNVLGTSTNTIQSNAYDVFGLTKPVSKSEKRRTRLQENNPNRPYNKPRALTTALSSFSSRASAISNPGLKEAFSKTGDALSTMLRKQKEDEESQYVATEFAPDPAFAPSFAPAPAPAPAPVSINTKPVSKSEKRRIRLQENNPNRPYNKPEALTTALSAFSSRAFAPAVTPNIFGTGSNVIPHGKNNNPVYFVNNSNIPPASAPFIAPAASAPFAAPATYAPFAAPAAAITSTDGTPLYYATAFAAPPFHVPHAIPANSTPYITPNPYSAPNSGVKYNAAPGSKPYDPAKNAERHEQYFERYRSSWNNRNTSFRPYNNSENAKTKSFKENFKRYQASFNNSNSYSNYSKKVESNRVREDIRRFRALSNKSRKANPNKSKQDEIARQLQKKEEQLQTNEALARKLQTNEELAQQLQTNEAFARQLQKNEALAHQLQKNEALAHQLQTNEALAHQLQTNEALAQQLQTNEALAYRLQSNTR
jgi:hypothetical protein